MITAEELVKSITLDDGGSNVTKLATVVSLFASGKPKLKFDGEDVASEKEYEILGSYSPKNGDRVLLLGASGTWVILGSLGISGTNTSELFRLEGNLIKSNYNLEIQGWIDTLDEFGGQSYIKKLKTDKLEHMGERLGFFGQAPSLRYRLNSLSESASLSETAKAVKDILFVLKAYGLVS